MKEEKGYKSLNLLQEKINEAIEYYFADKEEAILVTPLYSMKGTRNRVDYTYRGEGNKIDFHFNSNGSTTIDLVPGILDEFKTNLANFLRESPICSTSIGEALLTSDNPYFVFKKMKYEEVHTVIDMILEAGIDKEIEVKNVTLHKYTLKSKAREKVVVTYYFATGTTLVQGRPLTLFTEIYTMLMELTEVKEMPKIIEQNLNLQLEITNGDVEELIEIYLPQSYEKINPALKKSLYQGIFNLYIQAKPFECSFLVYPALRAVEGHLKYVMKEKGIPLLKKKFSMFDKIAYQVYEINFEYRHLFTSNQLKSINSCYSFYSVNRHSLFHWEEVEQPIDTTRMIDNISEARSLIIDCFNKIDSYYH